LSEDAPAKKPSSLSVDLELLSTFRENLCQPLPAAILPGRPEMETSTLESWHSDGSGSGVSDGVGDVDVLGAGVAEVVVVAVAVALEVGGVAFADADLVSVGAGVVLVGVADAVSLAVSDTVVLGEGLPSVANAAGAESSASGAIAAVAAATAMARRSFMKTSESPVYRCVAVRVWGEASACGARVWPLVQQV
jgi:hypothetical protein